MATKADKSRVFYTLEQRFEHGYNFTTYTIKLGEERLLADLIEQCVDNKIGYFGTDRLTGEQIAMRQHERYSWMLANGYAGIFEPAGGYTTQASVALDFQHYAENEYCEANIELPTRLDSIGPSVKLLTRVVQASRRASGVTPYSTVRHVRHIARALERLRAIRLVRVIAPSDHAHHSELCTLTPNAISKAS